MKKFPALFTIFLLLFSFTSCFKEKVKKPFCTGTYYKAFYVSDYEFFMLYADKTIDGVHFKTGYTEGNSGTFSNYFTEMTIGNLCGRQIPIIGFEVWLKNEDAIASKTGYIEEPGKAGRLNTVLEQFSATKFYRASTNFDYEDTTGITPVTLLLHLDFGFPHQGNPSADSLYFFSNLEQLKTDIQFSYKGVE